MTEPLANRVIAIAESRELDVFAALLERRGARVLRYPLVKIIDAPQPEPILAWIDVAAKQPYDDLILLTGEGLRRLLSCIERHRPSLRGPFLEALGRMRKITRGPKPARALRELGLASDLPAVVPTTAGVIDMLRALDMRERRVGVQLYGGEPNRPLIEYLQGAGARVATVAPYLYADAANDAAVGQLLEQMRAGAVDAIAFTSKAQVERLFRAAAADQVRAALAATNVAAVGPVVRDALSAHGVTVEAMPEDSWFMKPLTAALSELLAK
ncbi:MAG TPA: uroporphyrinogen-III synthase [Steroidobacteraceae bacterium]|jgi:uroporphyrinogen-III synthase